MKKIVFFFSVLAACMMVSCNKETTILQSVDADDNQDGMQRVTISASIADATKTSYSSDPSDESSLLFSWTAGDEISVLCSDGNFYTFTAESTASTSTFSGSIPKGASIGAKAYFPANDNHTSSSYYLPSYKDITSHDSADIPMYGTKGAGDAFSFVHCAGALLITIENIPDGITSATIQVESNDDGGHKIKLSGLFYLYAGASPYWSGDYAAAETNENIYSRKVSVSDNTAMLYLPSAAGYNNWVSNKLSVTGHGAEGDVVLFSEKSMKAFGQVDRAHVTPLTPLVYSDLGNIKWPTSGLFSGSGRVNQWYATSDSRFIYVYIEYDRTDATTTSNTGNYLEVGFDLDNNQSNGEKCGYITNVEAWSRLYPITAYSGGVFTFGVLNPSVDSDSGSKIEWPIGTMTGAPEHIGEDKGTYLVAKIAIDRTKIGSPSSGNTIGIRVSSRSNVTGFQTIKLK